MQFTVTTEMGYALDSFPTRAEAENFLEPSWGETITETPDTVKYGDDVSQYM